MSFFGETFRTLVVFLAAGLIAAGVAARTVRGGDGPGSFDFSSSPFGPAGETREAPVEAEIFADTKAVAAGEKFTVGVLLRMEQDWHVYWRNPGQGGLETKLELTVPEGFRVGPVQWPLPQRFEQPGDIVGFGYEGSVLLAVEVTAPDELPADDPVRILAEVEYLACKDVCLPGSDGLAVTLPVGDELRPANRELFSRWRERLPLTGEEAEAVAVTEVSGEIPPGERTGLFEITLRWHDPPPREIDFFPATPPSLAVSRVQILTGPNSRIRFAVRMLAGVEPAPHRLETVVTFRTPEQDRRGLAITVPPRAKTPDEEEQPPAATETQSSD